MGTDVSMGNDVKFVCISKKPNQQANQTQPIQQQSDNAVFKLPTNLKPGDKMILVGADGSQTVCSAKNNETVNNAGTSDDAIQTMCTAANPPVYNFGSLTTGLDTGGLDIANFDFAAGIREALNKLNAQQAQNPGTVPQANNDVAFAPSGNNIYDIAFQKALEKLTKKLDEGKITEKEFITQLKELKKELKDSALQEVKEDRAEEEADVNEQRDKKLTAPQRDSLNKFLSSADNKTFTRDDFQKDEKISGSQTATQNIDDLGAVKTIKVLADGTTVEITEDKKKTGYAGAFKGQRGGLGTGIVGAAEMIGGVVLGALTSWTGFGIAAGAAMATDGARRIGNAANNPQAFTAIITRPDGSKQTIKSNDREDIYDLVYKNIGIHK